MTETVFTKVDYTLGALMNAIELGTIGLPDIQRPFVWKNAKVRNLFDSMYRGFPVKAYPVDSGSTRCSVAIGGCARTLGREGLNGSWRGDARLPSFSVRFPMRRVARHFSSRAAGPIISPALPVARLALSR